MIALDVWRATAIGCLITAIIYALILAALAFWSILHPVLARHVPAIRRRYRKQMLRRGHDPIVGIALKFADDDARDDFTENCVRIADGRVVTSCTIYTEWWADDEDRAVGRSRVPLILSSMGFRGRIRIARGG